MPNVSRKVTLSRKRLVHKKGYQSENHKDLVMVGEYFDLGSLKKNSAAL